MFNHFKYKYYDKDYLLYSFMHFICNRKFISSSINKCEHQENDID